MYASRERALFVQGRRALLHCQRVVVIVNVKGRYIRHVLGAVSMVRASAKLIFRLSLRPTDLMS